MRNNKSDVLQIRLAPATIAKLERQGREIGLNKSTLARTLIMKGLRESQPTQPTAGGQSQSEAAHVGDK